MPSAGRAAPSGLRRCPCPMITAYAWIPVGDDFRAPRMTADDEGVFLGRTLDDTLASVVDWPVNVYVARVDPREITGGDERRLRARRFDLMRALPREEVFGQDV